MPVYEYRCPNGHFFDKTEGFDAAREQPCPICGAIAVRQISLPAVIFKGPGFYSTDNRSSSRGGNGQAAEKDSGSMSSEDHRSGVGSGSGETTQKAEAAPAD